MRSLDSVEPGTLQRLPLLLPDHEDLWGGAPLGEKIEILRFMGFISGP